MSIVTTILYKWSQKYLLQSYLFAFNTINQAIYINTYTVSNTLCYENSNNITDIKLGKIKSLSTLDIFMLNMFLLFL